jgi:DNA-binding NarL/FixJ family response regulator
VIELANAHLAQSTILGHLGETTATRASADEARQVISTAVDPSCVRLGLATVSLHIAEPSHRCPAQPAFSEQLSPKEIAVLRLMATPLSRSEISAHLECRSIR